MIILKYDKKNHQEIIRACVVALLAGKSIGYPTDTSYGIAVDPTNKSAWNKLHRLKGRSLLKPTHVIPPSLRFTKSIVRWERSALKLAWQFWPGPITLVLPLISRDKTLQRLSAGSGYLGIRMPADTIALDLAKALKKPLPATSANVSGLPQCYSATAVLRQFRRRKHKPDILIDAGTLPKRKPSTLIKIDGDNFEILRKGPVSLKQITKAIQ